MIDRGQCLLAVVIPRDYSRNLLSSQEAEVQLLLDGSDSNTASIALGYAEALVRAYSFELRTQALNREGRRQARTRPSTRSCGSGTTASCNRGTTSCRG